MAYNARIVRLMIWEKLKFQVFDSTLTKVQLSAGEDGRSCCDDFWILKRRIRSCWTPGIPSLLGDSAACSSIDTFFAAPTPTQSAAVPTSFSEVVPLLMLVCITNTRDNELVTNSKSFRTFLQRHPHSVGLGRFRPLLNSSIRMRHGQWRYLQIDLAHVRFMNF